MNELKVIPLGNSNINSIYKITFENRDYVLRISNYNNIFESKVLKKLKTENINCPTIRENLLIDNKYIMICDYINGYSPNQIDMTIIRKLLLEVKKLHKVKFDYIEDENENYESIEKLKEYNKVAIKSKYLERESAFISNCIKRIDDNLELDILPTNIIHSDIKSENIIVNDKGVYLIDFGNAYIGNRLIDIIRIIMWFFIRYDNYDLEKIQEVIDMYFDDNDGLTVEELYSIDELLEFCLLYNLLKDIYLFENNVLKKKYIESCSLKWLEALKNSKNLENIMEVLKNAKRLTK